MEDSLANEVSQYRVSVRASIVIFSVVLTTTSAVGPVLARSAPPLDDLTWFPYAHSLGCVVVVTLLVVAAIDMSRAQRVSGDGSTTQLAGEA